MPCLRLRMNGRAAFLTVGGGYKPGDQAPEGYLDWQEWAGVQHKAGLRQKMCGRCMLWRYPQELSAIVDRYAPVDRRGNPHPQESPVCNKCAAKSTSEG